MRKKDVHDHRAAHNSLIGISWFVIHCLLFALISIVTKILLKSELHVFEIVFFQTFFGVLLLTPWIIKKHPHKITSVEHKINILRAVFWAAATILFFQASKIIPLNRAVAISFAVPLFTSLLAVFFLKEKLHLRRIIALIIGFTGMLIIIQPGFAEFNLESYLVVLAAFLWSSTDIMLKVTTKTHHAFINTYYFSLFSAIVTLPISFLVWKTPDSTQLFWLIILAVLFITNIISITKSYEKTELTTLMPFVFCELIFIAILAYFIFDETISYSTMLGSAVIIVSSSYIAAREKIERHHFSEDDLAKKLAKNI